MSENEQKILDLRDLQIPKAAFYTNSTQEKEGLVTDWIDSEAWAQTGDGMPQGLIVCGGKDRDLAWALLRKEVQLAGGYCCRITHAELAMFARAKNITPPAVLGAFLDKAGYPREEEEGDHQTLTRGHAHFFIEGFDEKVTKDMLIENFTRECVLLFSYYVSVYIRTYSLSDLQERHGPGFVDRLKGGEYAKLGVWE